MNDQISPVSETPTSLIDRRLTDLREANDVFRGMDWDKSRDIQRNDREIRWLIDLRTVLTSDHAPTPAAQPCGLRDRADRVLGEWWFWGDENLSSSERVEILDGICADTSTDRGYHDCPECGDGKRDCTCGGPREGKNHV